MAEPAPQTSNSPLRSRRALLAGAFGGIGALAATVIGGASRTAAAAGSPLIIGSAANNAGSADTQLQTSSSVVAFKLLQNGPGTALMGYATPATGATRGVYGRTDSPDGFGVQARNAAATGLGAAVQAIGVNNHGVDASTSGINRFAVRGEHTGFGGNAIRGVSQTGPGIYGVSSSGQGVYGLSTSANGLRGASDSGNGVYGISGSGGFAGYFAGRVRVTQYVEIPETTAPANPAANTARLFVRDSGGKTQLCVIFPTGVLQVIKTEV